MWSGWSVLSMLSSCSAVSVRGGILPNRLSPGTFETVSQSAANKAWRTMRLRTSGGCGRGRSNRSAGGRSWAPRSRGSGSRAARPRLVRVSTPALASWALPANLTRQQSRLPASGPNSLGVARRRAEKPSQPAVRRAFGSRLQWPVQYLRRSNATSCIPRRSPPAMPERPGG